MKEYTVTLDSEPTFWLGEHFFKVDSTIASRKEFYTRCPSCNNERRVKYILGYNGKEYETECPICRGAVMKGYDNRIELKDWHVNEYVVNCIDAQGPMTFSSYKNEECVLNSIRLEAFCKTGRCLGEYKKVQVPWTKNCIDPVLSELDMDWASDYVFHKKKDAETFCRMLKDYDRKRLTEFNEKYQTNYEYPF